jgi:PAS domain S-box-containing protein
MNMATRITVTAAEFTRRFGQLRQTLGDRPVFVTHHGRETHVLLSAARFAALREQQDRPEGAPALPRGVADWIRDGLILLDPAGAVRTINEQAAALLGCNAQSVVGLRLADAVPALRRTVMETIMERALATCEHASADVPHPDIAGRWIQLAVHPAAGGATVVIRDITAEVSAERLADEATSFAAACVAHPDIAQLRVNPRGHLTAADGTLCDWIGLDSERLRGVAVADLMPTARKAEFRAALDDVLSNGSDRHVTSALLTNRGTPLPVTIALSRLAGCYGVEGAVLLATRGERPAD